MRPQRKREGRRDPERGEDERRRRERSESGEPEAPPEVSVLAGEWEEDDSGN